jgi:hypothetical protein
MSRNPGAKYANPPWCSSSGHWTRSTYLAREVAEMLGCSKSMEAYPLEPYQAPHGRRPGPGLLLERALDPACGHDEFAVTWRRDSEQGEFLVVAAGGMDRPPGGSRPGRCSAANATGHR